jgi:hypothetical protein
MHLEGVAGWVMADPGRPALKESSNTKLPYEVLLSFEAGILRLRGLGMAVELPAEGAAACDVRVESGKLLGLARLLPEVDPMPISQGLSSTP